MALAPKFAAQRLAYTSVANLHVVEVYLDYVCPFSAKMFNTLYNSVAPVIEQKYSNKVSLVFRQQVQPWHPSSTLVHEAALAVLRLSPEKFWPFSDALMRGQKAYFDVNVADEGRNATYKRLAKLGESVGVDADGIYDLLKIGDAGGAGGALNGGNAVTDDLKVAIKMGRLVGVHASPTVVFDGVVANEISSSWTVKEWEEWLEKNCSD